MAAGRWSPPCLTPSLDGLRLAEPGEFTRRALANGRIDLTEAEGLADLLEAETEMQRRAALAVAGGALSRRIDAWQAVVLSLSARAEAAIDYVGDEDETAIDIAGLRAECVELAEELAGWLARPRAEPLKDGIRVVVAGPPNAGKSSLVNALVGIDRAIVSASPGTTRDSIEVPLAVDGVPLVLVDTAGLRQTDDSVEAMGVARTRAELERAELLLWLGNPADAPLHANRLFVTSKADQPAAHPVHAAISVSAVTGLNLALLLDQIKSRALALLPANDDIPLNQRQADAIAAAHDYLMAAPSDLLVLAETLRSARVVFDRLTGRATIDDVIDALFSRFCLGK